MNNVTPLLAAARSGIAWRQLLTWALWGTVIASGFRQATPIALAALGETVSEVSGVLNIGLEGYMIVGSLAALLAGHITVWWVAMAGGIAAGMALALIMALLSVRGGASQIVVGFLLTILGLGLTGYVYRVLNPVGSTPITMQPVRAVPIPGLVSIPAVGPVFFRQNPFTWIAIVLILITWWLLERTSWGLRIRACGEDPDAAAVRGVNVVRVRFISELVAGGLAGLGGASLTVGLLGFFVPNITAGDGFVAIAVVLMAQWNVGRAAAGALLFGLASGLGLQLQSIYPAQGRPTEAFLVLPYVVTLIVLIAGSRVQRMPRALGQSFIAET